MRALISLLESGDCGTAVTRQAAKVIERLEAENRDLHDQIRALRTELWVNGRTGPKGEEEERHG